MQASQNIVAREAFFHDHAAESKFEKLGLFQGHICPSRCEMKRELGRWRKGIPGPGSGRRKRTEPTYGEQCAGKPGARERQSSRSGDTKGELRVGMKGLDAFIV